MTDKNKTKELLDLIKDPELTKLKDLMEKAKSEMKFDDIIKRLNELKPWHAPGDQEIKREEIVEKLESCFSEEEEALKEEVAFKEEKALTDLLWKLPGIAKKDKHVFIPLLAYNILENIYSVLPDNKTNADDMFKKKILIALMICLPFMDYQQAFDGNLYDPRVIILGINPRFKADTFYDYERKEEKGFMVGHMKEVYDKPICEKNRPMLYKRDKKCPMPYKMDKDHDKNGNKKETIDLHIAKDDYYYGKCGHFYPNITGNLIEKHRSRCLGKEGKNPLAFLELFPYATKGINTWWGTEDLIHACKLLQYDEAVHNDIKAWATDNMNDISNISSVIKNKIGLNSDELLYSQQWILCLLYCILIKNDKSQKNTSWFIISTKFEKGYLKRLYTFINTAPNIKENPNFCLLATNSQNRSLAPTNLSVVTNGELGTKINELNAKDFWGTRDTTESQNATDSTNSQNEENLNNQAFRRLWGIDE